MVNLESFDAMRFLVNSGAILALMAMSVMAWEIRFYYKSMKRYGDGVARAYLETRYLELALITFVMILSIVVLLVW